MTTIPLKIKIEITPEFENAFKEAIKSSVDHITTSIKKEIHNDSGRTASNLEYDINYRKGNAEIKWKSEKDKLTSNVLQFGSGERGRDTYRTSKFGESKPDYTVPIVPTHSPAMKFIGRSGNWVSMKEFKGHFPKFIVTKGTENAMPEIPMIFYNNFNK